MKTADEIIEYLDLDKGGEFNTNDECKQLSILIKTAMQAYAKQSVEQALQNASENAKQSILNTPIILP